MQNTSQGQPPTYTQPAGRKKTLQPHGKRDPVIYTCHPRQTHPLPQQTSHP